MKDRGVSIAGDGVEIGRLQILMDSKRTSDIKNCILESRFDDNFDSGVTRDDTKGWKIVRESLSKKNSRISAINALKGTNSDMVSAEKTNNEPRSSEKVNTLIGRSSTTKIGGLTIQHQRGSITRSPSQLSGLRIRNSHMGLRKSNIGIDQNNRIEEEGNSTTQISNPLGGNKQGWKVLRESIKRREFTDNLRESSLQLHEMDEIAFSGRSSTARRQSLRNSTCESKFHPAIQQQYMANQSRRKSVALADGEMYSPSDDSMGFATISIDSSRRKSQAGSGLSGSMNQDIQLMLDLRDMNGSKQSCCTSLFKSCFKK